MTLLNSIAVWVKSDVFLEVNKHYSFLSSKTHFKKIGKTASNITGEFVKSGAETVNQINHEELSNQIIVNCNMLTLKYAICCKNNSQSSN